MRKALIQEHAGLIKRDLNTAEMLLNDAHRAAFEYLSTLMAARVKTGLTGLGADEFNKAAQVFGLLAQAQSLLAEHHAGLEDVGRTVSDRFRIDPVAIGFGDKEPREDVPPFPKPIVV